MRRSCEESFESSLVQDPDDVTEARPGRLRVWQEPPVWRKVVVAPRSRGQSTV